LKLVLKRPEIHFKETPAEKESSNMWKEFGIGHFLPFFFPILDGRKEWKRGKELRLSFF
jgi:hypothetical protein